MKRQQVPPPRPGEILRDVLDEDGAITQDRLATALGVSRFSVNQLVNGHRAVTASMALRLARALGTTPDFWLNLQREVDLAEARAELSGVLTEIPQLRKPSKRTELFYDIAP